MILPFFSQLLIEDRAWSARRHLEAGNRGRRTYRGCSCLFFGDSLRQSHCGRKYPSDVTSVFRAVAFGPVLRNRWGCDRMKNAGSPVFLPWVSNLMCLCCGVYFLKFVGCLLTVLFDVLSLLCAVSVMTCVASLFVVTQTVSTAYPSKVETAALLSTIRSCFLSVGPFASYAELKRTSCSPLCRSGRTWAGNYGAPSPPHMHTHGMLPKRFFWDVSLPSGHFLLSTLL